MCLCDVCGVGYFNHCTYEWEPLLETVPVSADIRQALVSPSHPNTRQWAERQHSSSAASEEPLHNTHDDSTQAKDTTSIITWAMHLSTGCEGLWTKHEILTVCLL
jgi:hypothetical protein